MKFRKRFSMFSYICVVVLFCAVLVSSTMAQESDTVGAEKTNEWAMLFQVGDNFNLSAFQGRTISLKKTLAPGRHFRTGVSLDGLSLDRESSSLNEWGHDDTSVDFSVDLVALYLVDWIRDGNFVAYAGAGPMFEYDYFHAEYDMDDLDEMPTDMKQKNTETLYGISLEGVLGVEWFVLKDISLLAEYHSGLGVTRRKDTKELETYREGSPMEYSQDEDKITNFRFNSGGVRVGLSLYF